MIAAASQTLHSVLEQFPVILLEETRDVNLMDRMDTKYVVCDALLPELLSEVQKEYHILMINGGLIQTYESIYFDTANFDAYLAHHNRRLNRTKIRMRHYVESELSFFEVKLKNNHLRTVKKRVSVPFMSHEIPFSDEQLAELKWPHGRDTLHPVIAIDFTRIMLASLERSERVSVDTHLRFRNLKSGKEILMNGLAVIEVKRNLGGADSPMRKQLKERRIKSSGFSKFCVGVVQLFPEIKRNEFKKLLHQLDKINPYCFDHTGI